MNSTHYKYSPGHSIIDEAEERVLFRQSNAYLFTQSLTNTELALFSDNLRNGEPVASTARIRLGYSRGLLHLHHQCSVHSDSDSGYPLRISGQEAAGHELGRL